MKPDKQKNLLTDLFSETDLAPDDLGAVRQAALGAYRQAIRGRTLRRLTALGALIAVSTVLVLTRHRQPRSNDIALTVKANRASAVQPKEELLISDEELLAAFPTNSCFIAELNGKKILVFHDAGDGRKFIR